MGFLPVNTREELRMLKFQFWITLITVCRLDLARTTLIWHLTEIEFIYMGVTRYIKKSWPYDGMMVELSRFLIKSDGRVLRLETRV